MLCIQARYDDDITVARLSCKGCVSSSERVDRDTECEGVRKIASVKHVRAGVSLERSMVTGLALMRQELGWLM